MGLELDLARRVDRLVPLPVVLEDDVVDDELVVEIDGHALADHDDAEGVPLADGAVGLLRGSALPLLVVVEAARADRVGVRVPDLDLGRSPEIEAAVAALLDLPVDEELEIAVIGGGAKAFALAVEDEDAVDDLPVGPHPVVGFGLCFGQLLRRHLGPGRGIGDETLPAVEAAAVEERHETALAQAGQDDRSHSFFSGGIGGPGLDAPEDGVRLVPREPSFLGRLFRGQVEEAGRGRVAEDRVIDVSRQEAEGFRLADGRGAGEDRLLVGVVEGLGEEILEERELARTGHVRPPDEADVAFDGHETVLLVRRRRRDAEKVVGRLHSRATATGRRRPRFASGNRPLRIPATAASRAVSPPTFGRIRRMATLRTAGALFRSPTRAAPRSRRERRCAAPRRPRPPGGAGCRRRPSPSRAWPTRRGRSASPASLARAPRAAARVAGSGSEARAKMRSISPRAPFSPMTSMSAARPGSGVASRSRTASGTTRWPSKPSRAVFRAAASALAGGADQTENIRHDGFAAETDCGWDGGQADTLLTALQAIPDEGEGRLVPPPAEHPDDLGPDLRPGGRSLLDPSGRRFARSERRRHFEGGAAEGADRAVDGTEKVGMALVFEDGDEEGEGFRGDVALLRAVVGIEDRSRRGQRLGRLAGFGEPAGEKEIEPRRLGPLGQRRSHADIRERRGRRLDRRCWPGRSGPPGGALRRRFRPGGGAFSRLHGCAFRRGRRRSRARAPGGAVSSRFEQRPGSLGTSDRLERRGGRSGQRFVSEISRQGLDGLRLPGELDLGDEEGGDLLVRVPGQGAEQGPHEKKPLGFRARPGHVDGEAVHGEPGLGIVARAGGKDAGAGLGDARRTELDELGAQRVPRGGSSPPGTARRSRRRAP